MGPCKEMGGSRPKKPQTPQALEDKNSFFSAVLVLRCRTQAFSSYGEWGLLLLWTSRLLIAVASLVGTTGLEQGFRRCGSWAELPVDSRAKHCSQSERERQEFRGSRWPPR